METYPHPAQNLALFQGAFTRDTNPPTPFNLACSMARPKTPSDDPCCDPGSDYNSEVDMQTTGSIVGEVNGYPYNRLNLADIVSPGPYYVGNLQYATDLLPQLNAASSLSLGFEDLIPSILPTEDNTQGCACSCNHQYVFNLKARDGNLLYYGQAPITLIVGQVDLKDVLTNPFVSDF